MTKSNDHDPWLGGKPEERPNEKKQVDTKPEEDSYWIPPDGTNMEIFQDMDQMRDENEYPIRGAKRKPEVSVADSSIAKADEVPESETNSENVDENAGDDKSTEWVPTDIPEKTRSGRDTIELYTARKGARDTTFIQRSEATYVPSEPKLYLTPRPDDENDRSESGFPEVPENTQRLFIAIEIPRKVKREFSDLAKSFRPREYDRVRWIEEDAMHLTLKFLGDTPIDMISDIESTLERAAQSTGRFTVKIGRTGCFPSFVDPRICWVGFTGELRRLEQLQGRVEGGMVALGLEPEDRDFRGHITVGRTRPGIRGRFAEDIGISWQHAPLHTTGQVVAVNAIALYRSYLDDTGDTHYQQLGNFELG